MLCKDGGLKVLPANYKSENFNENLSLFIR